MTPEDHGETDRFDDEHYPAYTMGRAADMIGTTPAFLRSVERAHLFEPARSEGGHRRYSRYQLRLVARVREIADQGTSVEAACRIVILEDQLAEALDMNARHQLSRPAAVPGNA
jgi:DNA-binding transcriptional MerR regulator